LLRIYVVTDFDDLTESEGDTSPPSSVEVKNAWSYTSTIPIRLHGIVLS
jgi:hypothetical protein